jgi:hypothetical protein
MILENLPSGWRRKNDGNAIRTLSKNNIKHTSTFYLYALYFLHSYINNDKKSWNPTGAVILLDNITYGI